MGLFAAPGRPVSPVGSDRKAERFIWRHESLLISKVATRRRWGADREGTEKRGGITADEMASAVRP